MGQYMIATKAFHNLGEISRSEPDLCIITREEGEYYIGNWATGYGFMDVKFPKNTTRDLTAEERKKYHGMGIILGNEVIDRVYIPEEDKRENPKKSPIIKLPTDPTRQNQLKEKLQEYKQRLKNNAHRHPQLQMGTICKLAILERLLEKKEVKTWDLSRELAEKYPESYKPHMFDSACAVIDDYCLTGGKNVHGGTSLPSGKIS